jgi:hypothetical protein
MTDHDELLARADAARRSTINHPYALIADLAAALRAALATRADDEDRLIAQAYRAGKAAAGSATPTGDDELARLREFVAAHDAVEHLIADFTDDRAVYNAAVERFDRARAAVAGSATPTDYDDNGWETLRHDIGDDDD